MSKGHSIDEGGESHVPATGTREVEFRPQLTVRSLAKKLEEIEKDPGLGYERALICVEMLSYMSINALVDLGGPDNDPNLMPSRFCILKGATDKGLKEKENLDPFGPKSTTPKYDLHKSAQHAMSVQNLADLLIFAGYIESPYPSWTKAPASSSEQAETSEPRKFDQMDDELVGALNLYCSQGATPLPDWELPKSYKVDADDSLSSIARELGIRNWRLLWEMNKDSLGEKWDRPPVGTELKLPDPTKDPLGPEKSFAKWLEDFSSPLEFADKGYQYPGIYLSLTILDDQNNVAKFDPATPFSVHLRGKPALLIHHAEVSSGDEIDFVIPDGPNVSWGLKGRPMSSLGEAWFYYTEDEFEEPEPEGLDRNHFENAEKLMNKHVSSNKEKQK
ncbi:MAG: LysM domain-containing protein [Fibrobacterota bacterium]